MFPLRRLTVLALLVASCGEVAAQPDDGLDGSTGTTGTDGGGNGTSTSPSDAGYTDASTIDAGPPAGPFALAQLVDKDRYTTDLTAIALPRVPNSPQWKVVQDLCAARFAAYGYKVELHSYETGVNVLGVREGTTDAEHRVIIGAHYDSVADCPGADDNASGLAGVLEAARVLSMVSYPRTLVVACWDEEESGLIGSKAHAKRSADAGEKIDAVFDFEMIGYKDDAENTQKLPTGFGIFFPEASARNDENGKRANFIAAVGDPGSAAPSQLLQAYSDKIGLLFVPLQLSNGDLNNPFLADLKRSDHAAFWANGFPAMMITDTSNFRYDAYLCYNGTVDSVDRVNTAFATQVVQATVGAAAHTLGFPSDLPHDE